jgi:cyclophilin family peptidyl-prolyl cis-trans isomerase
MNIIRFLSGVTAIILVLAGIQWYQNTRPSDYFNQYGFDTTASSTPISTNDVQTPAPTTTVTSSAQNPTRNTNNSIKNSMHNITIETNKGTIVFETYDADAPKTVQNFITLAQKGFYNDLIFHRVIKDFMIQGGDPTGTGMSGPGYKFEDELNPVTPSYKAGYARGVVAMANSGPNTNGSQFFIMHKDVSLPHNYTIFGKVVSGLDIVDAIAMTQIGPNDKPASDIVMKKVTVSSK